MKKWIGKKVSNLEKSKADFVGIVPSTMRTQEEYVFNFNAENLRIEILNYLENSSVDEKVAEDISILIKNKLLLNVQVASKVLAYGNEAINSQVKMWVLNHIGQDVSIKTLKLPAISYFLKHPDETDISKAIDNADDSIKKFAEALFVIDHPELTIDIISCLLGNTVNVTMDDI